MFFSSSFAFLFLFLFLFVFLLFYFSPGKTTEKRGREGGREGGKEGREEGMEEGRKGRREGGREINLRESEGVGSVSLSVCQSDVPYRPPTSYCFQVILARLSTGN